MNLPYRQLTNRRSPCAPAAAPRPLPLGLQVIARGGQDERPLACAGPLAEALHRHGEAGE
jgi:Asp-tRNA(Asn)/Glu-tRNA(Gln) amidotransferase A subunit family amidase